MFPEPRDKAAVMFSASLAKIGQACDFPKPCNAFRPGNVPGHLRHVSEAFQYSEIDGFRRSAQRRAVRFRFKIGNQLLETTKARRSFAPVHPIECGELVAFNRQYFFDCEFACFTSHCAKAAIALMPPSAACNLRHFGDG